MTDAGYLLDTNIIIERSRVSPDSRVVRWFDSVPRDRLYLTPPVYEELQKGIDDSDEENPTKHRQWVEKVRHQYAWLELPGGQQIVMTEAMARILLDNNGSIPRKIYVDFLIGMIAINRRVVVATRNEKDFRRLGIPFINPFRYRGQAP